MESRKSKRSLRMALVLGAAVAGTALVGFGGLAAWNAYTENAGNSVAAGTLAHANNTSCLSLTATPISTGSNWCSAVITINGVWSGWTAQTGTIKIANTGSLTSTFQVSMAAGTGGLCADLTLKVTDLNSLAPYTVPVYGPTALTTAMPLTSIYSNAATPSLNWTGNGAAGTGTGATANTFTLTVGPGSGLVNDATDQGTNCTFNVLFTQAA
jgi:hypothetical protein